MEKQGYWILLVTVVVVVAGLVTSSGCRGHQTNREAQELGAELSALLKTAPSFQDGMGKSGVNLEKERKNSQYFQALNHLLKKYENQAQCSDGNFLKARIAIELGNYEEALKRLDMVIKSVDGKLKNQASLVKTRVLLSIGKGKQALELYQAIEAGLTPGERGIDYYSAWLYFALYSPDIQVRETYGKKLVQRKNLPPDIQRFEIEIYRMLSDVAINRGDMNLARENLSKAKTLTIDASVKSALESEITGLEKLGSVAKPVRADSWFNTPALVPESLKGKVIVLVFWAPWSTASLDTISRWDDLYAQYKDKNMVVIGCSKLYGTNGNPLPGELNEIANVVKTEHITFPIAISHEGYGHEDFGVTHLPTTFIIDRKGNIVYFCLGADPLGPLGYQWQSITAKLKKIVEEI